MGQNHRIMNDMTVKMHILQIDWQFQVSLLHTIFRKGEKNITFESQFCNSDSYKYCQYYKHWMKKSTNITIISTGLSQFKIHYKL